jgi:hypothetical protein
MEINQEFTIVWEQDAEKYFEPKTHKLSEKFMILRKEELHNLYRSPGVVKVMKLIRQVLSSQYFFGKTFWGFAL